MKTLRSILAIAILALFAACDDAEFDKAIIDSEENSSITCQLVEDGYSISWQPMTVRTNKGTAMYRNYYQEYMVCVSTDAVNYVNVKTVTGLSANVSLDEVSWALNGESVGSFYFGVRLSNSNHVYCTSSQISRGVYVKCDVIGGGSVSGGNKYYDYGETVILTAEPNTGCIFMGWSDGSTDNPRKLLVTEDVVLVANFSGGTYMTPLQYENTDFYFNKWFTNGSPLEIIGDDNNLAYAIEVPSAGDDWTIQFYNVIHGTQGQAEGNKFTFDCDVYWERDPDNSHDTADIHLLTGKMGYYAFHDDWQWSPEDNTELITNNEGGFWGYVHNQLREIPNKEWTHVSWGDELIIGEKGADYIGIQINLTNTAGTNNGTFYFRNIEIRMGNYNYIFEY